MQRFVAWADHAGAVLLLSPALAFALTIAAPRASVADVPVVHGGPRAPWAWAAVTDGALWVCWEPDTRTDDADDGCWTRVVLEHDSPHAGDAAQEDPLDPAAELPQEPPHPADMRLAFVDAATLVIGGQDGPGWALLRGQTRPENLAAISLDPGSLVLETPRIMGCSPTGWLPVWTRLGWGWAPAACDGLDTCLARRPRLRRHHPSGVRLSLAVEVGTAHRVAAPGTTALTSVSDVDALVAVVFRFDPGRLRRDRRELEELRARSRPQLRELPLAGEGPLAAAERSALRRLLCERSMTSW